MKHTRTHSNDRTTARCVAGTADTEAAFALRHSLDTSDLAAIGTARTPATGLGYAPRPLCLLYPGRHLRAGELFPAMMLTSSLRSKPALDFATFVARYAGR